MKFYRSISALLSVGALTFAAQEAKAADALALCEPGRPFLYPNGGQNIPWNPDQGGLGPLSNAEAVAAVAASFAAWQGVAQSSATYQQGAPLAADVDVTNFGPILNPTGPNGISEIVFDADGSIFDLLFGAGSGILGFAGPDFGDPTACTLLEGSAFLNGPEFDDATVAQDVMVHEFGHYTNLGHTELNGQLFPFAEGNDDSGPTPDNTTFPPPPTVLGNDIVDTMFPIYFGPTAGTRTPHTDDAASLGTLYPAADFAATTASIRGTIFAPDGVTRLSGVNVIARNVNNPFVDAVSTFSGAYTDGTAQSDPNVGIYELNNLTPGETYAVFVDTVTGDPDRFSNPILVQLPGPEEWYSAGDSSSDDATARTDITVAAGDVITGIDIVLNQAGPGDPLPLGDDDTEQLFPPFPITLCGQTFTSLFVNSNGSVTFGAGDTDFSETPAEMLSGPPRVAGVWDDLAPNQGGVVTFFEGPDFFTVSFQDVPEFFATTTNSFDITFYPAAEGDDANKPGNRFEVSFGGVAATDGITGLSCGGAITSGLEAETDFAEESQPVNTSWRPAVYEQFTGAADSFDLAGQRIEFTETLPFFDDFESNDTFLLASQIDSLPFATGLEFAAITAGDVDWYRFDIEESGTIVAEVTSGTLDSILGLFRLNGDELELVAFNDDSNGTLLSRIEFEADGETPKYFLAVSTFGDATFTGAAADAGRYGLSIQVLDGVPVVLGDDASLEVPLSFGFPFQGATYSSVFVNSNGNLTFGSGDTDFSESVSELLADQPRIAALWDDLSPNQGGQVLVKNTATEFSVTFDAVPEFFATTGNSFKITLTPDGGVSVVYGSIAATDGIAGVSPGGGASDPGSTDLSEGGLSVFGVTYEQFGFANPNDLGDSTLTYDLD